IPAKCSESRNPSSQTSRLRIYGFRMRSAAASGMTFKGLNLEPLDLVPQRAVLALVGRPDLLLRDLAELVNLGLDDHHAERLELRLRLGEVVNRLGRLADLALR